LQRRILADRQARVRDLVSRSRDLCARARTASEHYGAGFPDLVGREPVWDPTPETIGEADDMIPQILSFNERLAKHLRQRLAGGHVTFF